MERKNRSMRYVNDEMDSDEDFYDGNPYTRQHVPIKTFLKIPRWIYKIILILIACVLGLLIWFNRDNLTPANILEWIQTTAVGMGVGDGYPTKITGSCVTNGNFTSVNKQAVMVSDTALTILNSTAKPLVSRQHSFSEPIMRIHNGKILIYNLGGTGYQIEGLSKSVKRANTKENILAGDIANNGRYVLVTMEEGYCSLLTAYLSDHKEQYKYYFSEYYVTDIALNSSGTKAAVSAVSTKNGAISSQVYLFDFNNPKPYATFQFDDAMVLNVTYCENGKVIAVGDHVTSIIEETGNQKKDYPYKEQNLDAYSVDGGRAVLALSDSGNSQASKLVLLDQTGKASNVANLNAKIQSVDFYGDTAAVLAKGEILAFSVGTLTQVGKCEAGIDAKAIALLDEGAAYILGVSEIRLKNFRP